MKQDSMNTDLYSSLTWQLLYDFVTTEHLLEWLKPDSFHKIQT